MTTQENTAEMSLEPAARSVPLVAGDTPAMREWAEQLVARARAEGVELTGDDGPFDRYGVVVAIGFAFFVLYGPFLVWVIRHNVGRWDAAHPD